MQVDRYGEGPFSDNNLLNELHRIVSEKLTGDNYQGRRKELKDHLQRKISNRRKEYPPTINKIELLAFQNIIERAIKEPDIWKKIKAYLPNPNIPLIALAHSLDLLLSGKKNSEDLCREYLQDIKSAWMQEIVDNLTKEGLTSEMIFHQLNVFCKEIFFAAGNLLNAQSDLELLAVIHLMIAIIQQNIGEHKKRVLLFDKLLCILETGNDTRQKVLQVLRVAFQIRTIKSIAGTDKYEKEYGRIRANYDFFTSMVLTTNQHMLKKLKNTSDEDLYRNYLEHSQLPSYYKDFIENLFYSYQRMGFRAFGVFLRIGDVLFKIRKLEGEQF